MKASTSLSKYLCILVSCTALVSCTQRKAETTPSRDAGPQQTTTPVSETAVDPNVDARESSDGIGNDTRISKDPDGNVRAVPADELPANTPPAQDAAPRTETP